MRVTHAGLHLCRTGTFKMQGVFDMVYSLLVFVNIRVILYKTYMVLICGKYNTLTLEFKITCTVTRLCETEDHFWPKKVTPIFLQLLIFLLKCICHCNGKLKVFGLSAPFKHSQHSFLHKFNQHELVTPLDMLCAGTASC